MLARVGIAVGLTAVCLLSLGVRIEPVRSVFPEADMVVFHFGDADSYYHARGARWSFENYPHSLRFDPQLNFPDGAASIQPPLWDLTLATVAHGLGADSESFERVVAWVAPACAILTTIPIFWIGRRVRGPALGIGAAALYAGLSASAARSTVGNLDHHAAQSLAGAWLLLGYAAALDPQRSIPGTAVRFVGLALARLAVLLVWQGSLFYLVYGELALVLLAARSGRRDLLLANAASTAVTAVLVSPFAEHAGPVIGGPYTAVALSRLHVVALGSAAAVSAAAAILDARRPTVSGVRVARVVGLGIAIGAVLMLVPDSRAGILEAFAFVGKTDPVVGTISELQPLFARPLASVTRQLGFYALLLPVTPFVLWLGARNRTKAPDGILLLCGWLVYSGAFTLAQIRYSIDFAAVGSVAFALVPVLILETAARRIPLSPLAIRAGSFALGVLLLWPSLPAPRKITESVRFLAGSAPLPHRGGLKSPSGTLVHFGRELRALTPESAGAYEPGARPTWSILAWWAIGHTLRYVAERPVIADGFVSYVGEENFRLANDFYSLDSEPEAWETTRALQARYVVTTHRAALPPGSIGRRLHMEDGRGTRDRAPLEHFRLITEGPHGGVPLTAITGKVPKGAIPYKLFEVVPGAELVVDAPPGARVEASIEIATPTRRRFSWKRAARADDRGRAHLRVPYPTGGETPAHSNRPYRVRIGDRFHDVEVSEEAVRSGTEVAVPAPAGGGAPRENPRP